MQIKTDLEDFHRMRMFDLNEGEGQEITYYKDVEIEPGILPLVKLLNSKMDINHGFVRRTLGGAARIPVSLCSVLHPE